MFPCRIPAPGLPDESKSKFNQTRIKIIRFNQLFLPRLQLAINYCELSFFSLRLEIEMKFRQLRSYATIFLSLRLKSNQHSKKHVFLQKKMKPSKIMTSLSF